MAISQVVHTPHEKEAWALAARAAGGALRHGGQAMKFLGGLGRAGRGLGMAGRGALQTERAAVSALPATQRIGAQAFGGNTMRGMGRSMWNAGQRLTGWGKARATAAGARPPLSSTVGAVPPPVPGVAGAGFRTPGYVPRSLSSPRPPAAAPAGGAGAGYTPPGPAWLPWNKHLFHPLARRTQNWKSPVARFAGRSLLSPFMRPLTGLNFAMLGGTIADRSNYASQLQDAGNYGAARALYEMRQNPFSRGLPAVFAPSGMVADGLEQRGLSGVAGYTRDFAADPSKADQFASRRNRALIPGLSAIHSRLNS